MGRNDDNGRIQHAEFRSAEISVSGTALRA